MVEQVLNDREKTYGDFGALATAIQALRSVYRAAPSWNAMTAVQREVLDMDILKTCRILYGDPMHMDNWRDKAGYATLAAEEFGKVVPMAPAEAPKTALELLELVGK